LFLFTISFLIYNSPSGGGAEHSTGLLAR